MSSKELNCLKYFDSVDIIMNFTCKYICFQKIIKGCSHICMGSPLFLGKILIIRYIAESPASPVLTLMTSSILLTNILPSPISPLRVAEIIASIIASFLASSITVTRMVFDTADLVVVVPPRPVTTSMPACCPWPVTF